MKIFWSWQSDRDPKLHHYFVRDAIKAACKLIASDPEYTEANRPQVDHDTKDVAGTPDIAATILRKISEANVFIADMTPIGLTEPEKLQPNLPTNKSLEPKHLQNPNVMSELGYAERALGQERVILVANSAHYPGPHALPFDWRHRSGAKVYNLPDGASKDDISEELKRFAKILKGCIQPILTKQQPVTVEQVVTWQEAAAKDPCIWKSAEHWLHLTNRSLEMPKKTVRLEPGTRIFARVVPLNWQTPTRANLEDQVSNIGLVIRGKDGDWGSNSDGALSVWGHCSSTGVWTITNATQWFQNNGEVWAVNSNSFTHHQGRTVFSYKVLFGPLEGFLRKSIGAVRRMGGSPPIYVRLGAGDLTHTFWPTGTSTFLESMDSHVAVEGHSKDWPNDEVRRLLQDFCNKLRDAYGLPALSTMSEFEGSVDLPPLEGI